MALASGARLGPYEIVSLVGAGGMGEVYKAKDTRLDRTVAIKILPPTLAGDPQFRERFDREARTISQLDHPHICALYDVGQQDGTSYLVMQYLEGETLADRLAKGALQVDQALTIAIQIADALDKAHRAGIIHRDLKPGNVMLTKSGAKLLDFGLAKARVPTLAGTGASMLPTTPPMTQQGAILGTFQYMAPELIEGQDADARSDLFAFGAVVYEMATGRRAFTGETPASVIGAILKEVPPPMSQLQPLTPASFDHIVTRCLAKDPDERWQSASDVRGELAWMSAQGSGEAALLASVASRRARRERWTWVVASGLLLAALVTVVFRPTAARQSPTTWSFILPPDKTRLAYFAGPVAISPDGHKLAFVATTGEGQDVLWVRALDAPTAQPLPGTEGASYPFWSADNRSLGFFAGGKLKTTAASGGAVITVCSAPAARGGSWNQDGDILFAGSFGEIARVPASGGTPSIITAQVRLGFESSHRWPSFLPDGRHFLYSGANFSGGSAESASIYVGSLESKNSKFLLHARSNATYAAGYLLFVRDRTLMAQPFDQRRLELSGQPLPIAEQVQFDELTWRGLFASTDTGVLAFHGGDTGAISRLVMVDRAGRLIKTIGSPGDFLTHKISPDGQKLAVSLMDTGVANYELWLYDLSRGSADRLTFGPARSNFPIWAPNGQTIVFAMNKRGPWDVFERRTDGSGTEETLVESTLVKSPVTWSADGRFIAYRTVSPETSKTELWMLPRTGDPKPFVFLHGTFNVGGAQFSPDGRWLAYTSDESGRPEVYVTPFPVGDSKWQVSVAGGSSPRWRRDTQELFYLAADSELMSAEVNAVGALFHVGGVRPLFRVLLRTGPSRLDTDWTSEQIGYDASADGQWFIVNAPPEGSPPPITLITNWTASSKR